MIKQQKAEAIGQRAAFGLSCFELRKEGGKLHVFAADTQISAGLKRFIQAYPDDFTDCSISELAMVSAAAGFALEGFPTAATTFAPFLVLRAFESIRHGLGYMQAPVLLAGIASGLALGELGYTHCAIEDIGLISNIPGITIYSPTHPYIVQFIVNEYSLSPKPTYLRLTGAPGVFPKYKYDDPKIDSIQFLEGSSTTNSELLVISTGSITTNCLEAVKQVNSCGSSISLISVERVFPLAEGLLDEISNVEKILVVEEGLDTGLYSLIRKNSNHTEIYFAGHPRKYFSPGSYDFMLEQSELSVNRIYEKILELISQQSQ